MGAAPSNVGPDRIYRIPLVASKRGTKYPSFALLRRGDTVKSNALLRRLAEHGHIQRPAPMFMPAYYWGERGCWYVDTPGSPPAKEGSFVYADYFRFDIVYRDGSFFPYVVFRGLTEEGERLNVPVG